jgi:hypothetical protein
MPIRGRLQDAFRRSAHMPINSLRPAHEKEKPASALVLRAGVGNMPPHADAPTRNASCVEDEVQHRQLGLPRLR